jgi:hypothetical protein
MMSPPLSAPSRFVCASVLLAIAVVVGVIGVRAAAASPPFVRACGTEVYGALGPPARWQPHSVVVGALAFDGIGYAQDLSARGIRRAYRSGQGAFKTIVLVRRGRQVTVSVPTGERGHVALSYDPAARSAQTVAHGEQAVVFRACPSSGGGSQMWARATQFNGGIIVDGSRCVRLEVRVDGGPARGVRVPFGRGACAPWQHSLAFAPLSGWARGSSSDVRDAYVGRHHWATTPLEATAWIARGVRYRDPATADPPNQTLQHFPRGAIIVWAVIYQDPHPSPSRIRLDLAHARRYACCEAAYVAGAEHELTGSGPRGRYSVIVRIYFGAPPTSDRLALAQRALDQLVMPSPRNP